MLRTAVPQVADGLSLQRDAPLSAHFEKIIATRGTWLRERLQKLER